MRITTWNVNGLRAAIRKGLPEFLDSIQPDVLLLQEIRSLPEQLPAEWRDPVGWHVSWHPAERKGYAGTAVWSRFPLKEVGRGMDADDLEGRVLRVKVEGVEIISTYLPSGSSSDERQQVKESWMDRFLPWSQKLAKARRPIVIGGDLNVAHTEADIFYAKANQKTSGFMPHEREWFGNLLDVGWKDVVREQYGDMQGPYSWWSNRGRARELDRGWRIDYLLANRVAAKRVTSAHIDRDGGKQVSDHAPVSIDLE